MCAPVYISPSLGRFPIVSISVQKINTKSSVSKDADRRCLVGEHLT